MATTSVIPDKTRFSLGQLVITATAQAAIPPGSVAAALARHAGGDWGEICREDASSNAQALRYGGRVMSVYGQDNTRFWIITEADRSVTTVLLPQDY